MDYEASHNPQLNLFIKNGWIASYRIQPSERENFNNYMYDETGGALS